MTPPAQEATQYPNIRVERDQHVTTVTIDNQSSKNVCTGDMWVALGAVFREVAYSGTRAVDPHRRGRQLLRGSRPQWGRQRRRRSFREPPRRDASAR